MRAGIVVTAAVLAAWMGASAAEPQAESQPPATAPQPVKAPTSSEAKTERKTKLFPPGEKYLLRQGYKLEVHNGTYYFCRNEETLGTRLRDHKVCGTEETLARRAEANNDNVRENLKRGMIHTDGK